MIRQKEGDRMLNISEALGISYDEVHYMDFYRDIFPEGSFEKRGVYEAGKYNGIAVSIRKGEKQVKRLTVTDDLEAIEDMVQTDDFCLMSPISYVGKSRKSGNARFMYAMAIDLDGIETLKQWQFFIRQVERGNEMLSFVWGLQPTLFHPERGCIFTMSFRSRFHYSGISWSSWKS